MNRSIVINREFGSGGREVGRLISERTGLGFYDTAVLQEAATKRGVPANQLERVGACTHANPDLYFSYRRGGAGQGPHRAFVGL